MNWINWSGRSAPDPVTSTAAKPGIVVFGGTFDPVHRGHIEAALAARRALGIQDFRLLPAADPPHRSSTSATATERLRMLELALVQVPELVIDRCEMERDGPSYMVDTLQALRPQAADHPLVLVVGQDAANGLDRWHRWGELLDLAHLVVVSRPGESASYHDELAAVLEAARLDRVGALHAAPAGGCLTLGIAEIDISSTRLRAMLRAGDDVSGWLPSPVERYIRDRSLYR